MIWHKQDHSKAKEIRVQSDNKKVDLDPAGYFLIRVTDKQIEVGFCNNQHQLLYTFAGPSAVDLSKAIAGQKLGLSAEHLIYLGRELTRAQIALEKSQPYIQD